jgi:hypothetical protein
MAERRGGRLAFDIGLLYFVSSYEVFQQRLGLAALGDVEGKERQQIWRAVIGVAILRSLHQHLELLWRQAGVQAPQRDTGVLLG